MSFVHQEALDASLRWLRAGQDVHVIGDVGSGRTRVLRAVAESLRTSGAAVAELSGTAGEDSVPLGGFLTHPTLRPRGSVARWSVPEATSSLAEAIAGRRAVVVVDDVHLLDRPSLTVIDAVARRAPGPVRVVTTVPAGVPTEGPWSALARPAAAVPVAPLDVNEVATLLAARLGGQVDGGLAAAVAGRSGGNPRAAVTLAQAAAGAGSIRQTDGRWTQTGSLESVPTQSVLHGLLGGMPAELRAGLETLAWFGLLDVDHARTLLGTERLAALDAAGRIAIDERPEARLVAVNPPVLGQALRAHLSGTRRALLRDRGEELLGPAGSAGDSILAGAPRPSATGTPAADGRPVHQVTILTESVRTRAALWSDTWATRHDVASALPLLRLHLVDGMAPVDVDEVFTGTSLAPTDDPEEVAAYLVLRGQWAAQSGGTIRSGLLDDPGPSGRLVLDGAGETFLRYLDQLHGTSDRAPDAGTIDVEQDVPRSMRGYVTIHQARAAVEAGAPDRALDLLGSWQDSGFQRPFTHRLDSLRGDALLMVGQVDDAVAWARRRRSAAYDELSPFGVRLAARGLASALFVQGDHDRALRALSVVLRLDRCGPVQSPFDERIFGLAAVLHARAGHHEMARTLLDELERTPRPYVPVLDFVRPWARMEVEHAVSGGAPDGEPLWSAGERLWSQGRLASAMFSWALTPQRLTGARLTRLEEGFAAVHIPLLAPAVRLHRRLTHGTSSRVLESIRSMDPRDPMTYVAAKVASALAVQEGRHTLTADELAEATGTQAPIRTAAAGPEAGLTARETEITALVREGLTNREIASRLFLSVRTVESHLYRAMQKLGASDRRELAT
ncbi:helix-turn-helix transcriptional regulator [Isoptericola sp. G70]|uniref:helix-turn-helix transcriptional regulator n=1 Tax=Isoptericola sp. G70 TaxID=3376633 RepID=UPI003A7FB098